MFKALRLAVVLSALAAPLAAQEADLPAETPQDMPVEPPQAVPAEQPQLVITEAGDQLLSDFLWIARLLVIFADSPNDPRFVQQMEYIAARPDELLTRDVIVITDSDPAAHSAIREELRPRGFDLVLIGKDGQKYLRKPIPWDVREISRSIDKTPDRQQELDASRGK